MKIKSIKTVTVHHIETDEANKHDQFKLITTLEAENEILRNEIKQIRSITEIKGCICKRKFVKQIPSLVMNENLILKTKETN